jgi:3-dehydroquinate dehydratase
MELLPCLLIYTQDSYTLDLKMKNFYKIIQSEPPKVFKDLFDEILQNANLLSADYSKVVIDLKNNKKLLQLFTTNKKLQESIIKAQGFRILVAKQDMGKVSRIVKENGFFVEL